MSWEEVSRAELKMSSDSDKVMEDRQSDGLIDGDSGANEVGQAWSERQLEFRTPVLTSRPLQFVYIVLNRQIGNKQPVPQVPGSVI